MAGRQDSVLGEERLARVMEEGSGDAVGTRKPPLQQYRAGVNGGQPAPPARLHWGRR